MEDLSKLNIDEMSDEELEELGRKYQFSVPWQYDPDESTYVDPDTKTSASPNKDDPNITRTVLQELSWDKFQRSPQINTSVRGQVGRLAGYGFETSSDVREIQEVIEEVELDPRNRLYTFWPKYVGRSFIEGELFLIPTCHNDGFIEIDFLDPAAIESNQQESGIIFHPGKTTMPLIYCVKDDDKGIDEQIPSIFIARYPELLSVASKQKGFDEAKLTNSKGNAKFKNIGGFRRFVMAWDKSFITKRNIGHIRTVLEWIEHYDNLKKFEIDHKKSSGAYVWVIKFTDQRSWIEWMRMSDADRRKTGIAAKMTPGGKFVIGPNMEVHAVNPNLTKISDADTDILHMITGGLNEDVGTTTGDTARSTFASIKATRGPMSDRTADEISYFEKFLRHDFWGSIFFLKTKLNGFPEYFSVKEAVDFKNKKPVFKTIKRRPEMLIDICFPTSETIDMEARSKAFFGSKHASLHDTAGIPLADLVRRMGFGNLKKLRLKYETEKEKYPDLPLTLDAESIQERAQAEPARPKAPVRPKKGDGNSD